MITKQFYLSEFETRINPTYTFESLVKGRFNQVAVEAAKELTGIADFPEPKRQKTYGNPLTICADSGLGKTYLLHAIANKLKKEQPQYQCVLLNAENFINALIAALRHREIETFRSHFRNIDVILIDDIDQFINKERTQEELIHLINNWFEQDKQMVFTSGLLPVDMGGFKKQFQSRITMGLTLRIDEPDRHDNLKLIEYKTAQNHITLSSEVTEYLASRFEYDHNRLILALNSLMALSSIKTLKLSLNEVKKKIESLFYSTPKETNNKSLNNHYEEYDLYDNYNFAPVNELLGKFIDRVDSAYHGAGHSEHITTGFIDLDKITHGFKPGELVVIAGRPCMGTFELGVKIIAHVATKLKKGVAVFSLNRSADDIIQYIMALMTEIDLSALENGDLNESDWPKLTEAVKELSDSRIYINENKHLDFIT